MSATTTISRIFTRIFTRTDLQRLHSTLVICACMQTVILYLHDIVFCAVLQNSCMCVFLFFVCVMFKRDVLARIFIPKCIEKSNSCCLCAIPLPRALLLIFYAWDDNLIYWVPQSLCRLATTMEYYIFNSYKLGSFILTKGTHYMWEILHSIHCLYYIEASRVNLRFVEPNTYTSRLTVVSIMTCGWWNFFNGLFVCDSHCPISSPTRNWLCIVVYRTELNTSSPEYANRMRNAERITAEIMSGVATDAELDKNPHVIADRGLDVDVGEEVGSYANATLWGTCRGVRRVAGLWPQHPELSKGWDVLWPQMFFRCHCARGADILRCASDCVCVRAIPLRRSFSLFPYFVGYACGGSLLLVVGYPGPCPHLGTRN